MRKITVDTSRYEFSYGKAPRGYGAWFFTVQAGDTVDLFRFTGSYGAARAAAIARARELNRGYALILVES